MLGLIITGHGEFSKGLLHAGQMIAGKQENIENVMFEDGTELSVLQSRISEAVERQLEKYNGTIILTDLKGGTPFNVSMLVTNGMPQTAVLSGTNLPMIIEGALLSQFSESVDDLANQLIRVGQAGIDRPQLQVQQETANDFDEEDGI